jgi:beta-phosphoglucomutase-like phosphatase (HAD superfamily)
MTLHDLPNSRGRTAPFAGYGAVIFDMDGVVTDTASLHAAAWKTLFDAVLPALPGTLHGAFDVDRDYRQFVDGRSREDGVRTFLRHRGISLPEGAADDRSESLTINGLAARKQQIFAALPNPACLRLW